MNSQRILEFWFGRATSNQAIAQQQASLWWSKNPAVDAAMRTEFASWVDAAAQGNLADWQQDAESYLALIVLLDQFPRNIYRATPQAFAYDQLALQLSQQGVALGLHQKLSAIQRVFFYLPLEHAEELAAQDQAIHLFTQLELNVSADEQKLFAGYTEFARKHQQIIARFGRFPHRNAILGRASSAEELAFLQQPGSAF